MNQSLVIDIIKASLWNTRLESTCYNEVSFEEYEEFKLHALLMLPVPILSSLRMTDELRKKWEREICALFSYNCRYRYIQDTLPITVPYVILKGTAAAQYYPVPDNRIMGDIDIIPSREYFEIACNELLENGYVEISSMGELERGRHRTFIKNEIPVEVHAFFASMNDPEKAQAFDDMIVQNINSSHVLPDLYNGMVLIEHINQHLEEGVGLRQIIDWMLFVDKCLSDENWDSFQVLLQKTGLEKLAITTTKMCELYLGLPDRNWCNGADKKLCKSLMEYVLASGSFGNKYAKKENQIVSRLSRSKKSLSLFGEHPKRVEENWRYSNKKILMPFSWIGQGIQFFRNIQFFINRYRKSIRLSRMLDDLEVKKSEHGLVYFEDGKYIKK